MSNVPAVLVVDIEAVRNGAPGTFEYTGLQGRDGKHGMIFKCPCGCGLESFLQFDTDKEAPHPRWHWDGNETEPTLNPSVHNTGFPCKWHGWLRKGEWISV